MNNKYKHPADIVVEVMNRVYSKGMTTTSGGNFSVKDEDGNIWITPSGIDKGSLKRDDIVKVAPNGDIFSKHKPSIELPFHKMVYSVKPDMNAILHAHPPALVSVSLLRKKPKINLLPTFLDKVKKLDVSIYDLPGSVKLGEKIAKVFANGADAVMMDNHGIVVCGKDLYDAFNKFEAMETCATLTLECQTLGGETELTKNQIDDFKSVKCNFKSGDVSTTTAEIDIRNSIVDFSKRSYHHRLFSSLEGIYAVREQKDTFLVMQDDIDRNLLDASDIVKVQNKISEKGKKPSRYSEIIAECFKANSSINAISVSSPPYAMSFGVCGRELDSKTIPESYIMMREVYRISYKEFLDNPFIICKILDVKTPVVMVENALLFTAGTTLTKCFDSLEVTDCTAKTLLYAMRMKALGEIAIIPKEQVDEIKREFKL